MVDILKKLREPAAFVLLGALVLRLMMGLVSVLVLASNDRLDSFTAATRSVAPWVTDPFALVVLAGLVAACVLVDRTRRARQLTLSALLVAVAGIGLTFGFGVVGLGAEGGINRVPSFLVFLADLAIPVLVAVVLLKMLQAQPAPARPQPLSSGPYGQGRQDQYGQGQDQYGQVPPGQHGQSQQGLHQPTWQPDQAAGAAWNTAGDAASGAAASGWGTPGESGGWNPTGPVPSGKHPTEETQQIPRHGDQPHSPTAWGAAPYDRAQPNQPDPPAVDPDETYPGETQADERPQFGLGQETGSDPGAGSPQPRQDNDWWNTGRP